MPEIKFETGLVTYTINNSCEISFNPTDTGFIDRLFSAFDALDKKQDSYRGEIKKLTEPHEIFAFARARDEEMRSIMDEVFNMRICDALFGTMNVYAMAQGLPVWCNFLLAVMDECDTAFAREKRATNPRIKKYMEKYHK